MARATKAIPALDDATNDGAWAIETGIPYTMRVVLEGTSNILFHRWSVDAVAAKAAAAKGSAAKKTDDLESYVYRMDNGNLAIPGEYLRCAIIIAAKYRQDPRSPRKSAMDLFKAGVVCETELADLGLKSWEFVDRRRVMVQRAGVTRERPGVRPGWKASIDLLVLTPEYITPHLLREVIIDAGRLVGLGDFRPTFGRYSITSCRTL